MNHITVLSVCLALTACGGGGGGSTTSQNAPAASSTIVADIFNNSNSVYNVAKGDVNGDGLDDLVVSGWRIDEPTAYVFVLVQNANGTLTDRTQALLGSNVISGSQRAFIEDFDGDGRNDIFLPGFRDGNTITPADSVMFWNNGSSFSRDTFTDQAMAHGACIGDMNRDGKVDMFVGGAGLYVNNGNRSFTINSTVLSNNYFSACAIINEPSSSVVYFGNSNVVPGHKDAIAVFDTNLTLQYYTPIATDAARDTLGVFVADATLDGFQDFVITSNGITTFARQVVTYTGPATYALGTVIDNLATDFYSYTLTINNSPALFFGAESNRAKVYTIATGGFTSIGSFNVNSSINAVYQNSNNGKTYVLQLINQVFQTKEM